VKGPNELKVDLVEKMRLLHNDIQIDLMAWRKQISGFTPKTLCTIHAKRSLTPMNLSLFLLCVGQSRCDPRCRWNAGECTTCACLPSLSKLDSQPQRVDRRQKNPHHLLVTVVDLAR